MTVLMFLITLVTKMFDPLMILCGAGPGLIFSRNPVAAFGTAAFAGAMASGFAANIFGPVPSIPVYMLWGTLVAIAWCGIIKIVDLRIRRDRSAERRR